ncbi:hypothetical protein BLNAU_21871 [Blattamonas nauphoetae]|uniref:Uncharacterized protein n=1 Tax=Blattamonas nauphoetae TaxID=2049346 RepID=A0ABQ9WN25_9EUKA|nr:hypothetical protein BLNAU_24229 [Blattamonas nauphoetae]KAK2943191.1 hypothetical protein BLNAU_21871 [Blattamonas nauphoetae]
MLPWADLSILRMPLPLFEAILTMFHFDEQDAVSVHTNAVQPAESITTPQFSASASPVTTPSIIIPNPQSSERLGWDTALYPVNKAGQNQNTPCARRDRSARTPNPWYSGDVRPNNVLQPVVVVKIEELTPTPPFSIPASSTVNVNKEMRSAEPQQYQPSLPPTEHIPSTLLPPRSTE